MSVIARVQVFIGKRLSEIHEELGGNYQLTIICRHKSGDDKKSFFLSGEQHGVERKAITAMETVLELGDKVA